MSRNIIIAILIATLMSISLSFISKHDPRIGSGQSEVPAFQEALKFDKRLSLNNLVDLIVSQKLQYPVERVKWNGSQLEVDLRIPQLSPLDNHRIYDDLYRMVELSFVRVNNVNEVNVRVLMEQEGKQVLLIAMSADRRQLNRSLPEKPDVLEKIAIIEQNFRLYYGTFWKQNFENAS